MTRQGTGPVDMTAIARERALDDALLSRPGMIRVIAPAKVNLFLSVGAPRGDGMHAVDTVLHAVLLHDVVLMRSTPAAPGSGRSVAVACMGRDGVEPPAIAPEDNIAYRAVEALAAATGRTADEAVEIVIEKHVPCQAGLGGGSSDAAATLSGLARLWGIDPGDPVLGETARSLGADVAFFLFGGCARFEGAGERLAGLLEPRRESVVLVKPDAGLSTGAVYAEHDRRPALADAAASDAALCARVARDVPLANNLAAAAERLMPELARVREWLEAQSGVRGALLCGSGSSTFAVCDDFETAAGVAARAQAKGWWARATSFTSARAMPVPS